MPPAFKILSMASNQRDVHCGESGVIGGDLDPILTDSRHGHGHTAWDAPLGIRYDVAKIRTLGPHRPDRVGVSARRLRIGGEDRE